jgi:hypothetical protein
MVLHPLFQIFGEHQARIAQQSVGIFASVSACSQAWGQDPIVWQYLRTWPNSFALCADRV